jgi:hypothetical protein
MKLDSILQSDPNTPGIREIVPDLIKRVEKSCGKSRAYKGYKSHWDTFRETLGPWPNKLERWMEDVWTASSSHHNLKP